MATKGNKVKDKNTQRRRLLKRELLFRKIPNVSRQMNKTKNDSSNSVNKGI